VTRQPERRRSASSAGRAADPIELELFNHRFGAIAEEMGVVLCRSGFSPNIRERRDYSCAVFDGRGDMVAHAAHIPVHLGSTPLSVRAAISRCAMRPGDVVILNDPFSGGTHLPDVTVVAPVFLRRGTQPFAYVADRAHHADIGGITPGSMPLATEIFQEGLRLPPVRLVARGTVQRDILDVFLANARVPEEREGDLMAQIASLRVGAQRLADLAGRLGPVTVRRAMASLNDYAARLMRASLRALRPGVYRATDVIDDDGFGTRDIEITVTVTLGNGRARVDFRGSAPQVRGGLNANFAVTRSAVFYVFRSLAPTAIPANEGLMRPIDILAPAGTVVNAVAPAAVAGGNVETSQRIVDTLLRALARAAPERVPAASSGSMNNVAIGGFDPFRNRAFSYYETTGGGAGASRSTAGASCLHTHMTNTLNTPIEALEAYYPLAVTAYGRRWGSGGRGRRRGGDGIVRELQFLAAAHLTLLSERRHRGPYGLEGGGDGSPGRDVLQRAGRRRRLPAKVSLDVRPGDRLRVETAGGGGWGGNGRRRGRRRGDTVDTGRSGLPRR
jgi:N-methylhydantoinase B